MQIKIKTWKCECGYKQDFEPTQENLDSNFNLDPNFRVNNLKANKCPSCALKNKDSNLISENNKNEKIVIEIMGEDELDTHEIEDKDTKQKRKLTKAEKDEFKVKIQNDIVKFSAM